MNSYSSSTETAPIAAHLEQMKLVLHYQEAFSLSTGCKFHLVSKTDHEKAEHGNYSFLRNICVPVEFNQRVMAYLCAEPLRISDTLDSNFEDSARQMLDDGCSAADLRMARRIFESAPVATLARAEAIETMLAMLATLLEEAAEKWFLQASDSEPDTVRRAKKYILDNLTEPLSLEEVAEEAGVSPFHFCKVFKRATGLTFTNYVNSIRVEQAKRLLLKPQARVTEVAYDVGFQSLSQFNRSFRRVVSLSPTEYRSKLHHQEEFAHDVSIGNR